jgi:hypothetical protein
VPFGYENDCGGFGDVVLDVSTQKLTVERNDRFEDYTTPCTRDSFSRWKYGREVN